MPETIGPYRVVRRLGQGGMGVVYEVTHPDVPRSLVLKQLLRSVGERSLARFEREAEVMARVRHVGIVQIHQLGRSPEGPYLVAELVEGRSLDEVCKAGPVEPGRAARIVRGVADAVAAVHAAGVLHRDLKPSNVMLRKDDTPVLLDFGLARDERAQRLTLTGEVLGTPAYMAPEQAAGDSTTELDERCDVYGLGGLLFALLTGEPPFVGSSAVELLNKVLNKAPVWPSERGLEVPPGLEAILRKALSKGPEGRYSTAGHLRADLDRFLAGTPPLALKARGARWPLVTAGVALLAAAAGGAVALRAGRGGEAAVTSVVAVRPTRSAPPPPAVADAWSLPAGTTLVYDLALVEVVPEQRVTFGASLTIVAGEGAAGVAPLECVVGPLRCGMGSAGGQGVTYDTEVDPEGHPLAAIGRATGQTFTAELVLRTGEVRAMRGFREIDARVLEGPHDQVDAFMGYPGALAQFVGRIFNDDTIMRSMTSLTHVTEDGVARRVPWRPSATDGAYRVSNAEVPRPAMPSLSPTLRDDDRVILNGWTTFADGRMKTAELTQELVGGGADRRCTMTWGMTLRLSR